ncbi:CsbD family protein [Sphaerisporangium album]|uniref:CsbD family protein n=1 Tax=Sphaerisporangium album TaxID=509200 RepID=A0A367FJI4_9ACTN|nr:CsbD family protein [Sphaerisporangium album]RCG29992.1 CsbD family protein [Sphaerisporangium album]
MGTDDKMANKAEQMKGKAKKAAGDLTGDDEMRAQGEADEAKGKAKQAGERVKDAAKNVKDAFKR